MPPMADAAVYRPRRFRFVVFDWDGTLADSTAIIAEALQQACRDIGASVPDDVKETPQNSLPFDDQHLQ